MTDSLKNFIILQCRYDNRMVPYTSHFHMSYEVIYIKKGAIHLSVNNKSYDIGENSLIFISNLEEHSVKIISSEYQRYFVIFNSEKLDKAINNPKLLSLFKNRPDNFVHYFSAPRNTEQIMQNLIEEFDHRDAFSEEIIADQVKNLVIHLFRSSESCFPIPDKRIKSEIYAAQKYIDQHFKEDLKVSEIADMFYINMYYLSHSFKELTGYSPKKYLLLNRLSYAKTLLKNSDLSIEQVAIQSGFYDANSFIRSFRQENNITPSQYKKL